MARTIQEKVVKGDPDRADYHCDFGLTLNNLGLTLARLDQLDKAAEVLREAVAQQKLAFDKAPQVPRHRHALSDQYSSLGEVYRLQGRAAEAVAAARERRKLWPGHGGELFEVACELAQAAEVAGRNQDADRDVYLGEALATLRQAAAAGFRDRERLLSDGRLAAVRQREIFPP